MLAFWIACLSLVGVLLLWLNPRLLYAGPAYASFSSSTTQGVSALTEKVLTFDTVDIIPVGFTHSTVPFTAVRPTSTGTFKVLASIQIDKNTGGTGQVDMWVNVDGVAVPNSATKIQVDKDQELVMTVEWFLELAANQAITVSMYSPADGFRALAVSASSPTPAIPSIILTLVKLS